MKALEIKIEEKQSNVVFSFFNSSTEMFRYPVVLFDNGYIERLDGLVNDLPFVNYKDQKGFLNSWSNEKKLNFINSNINNLDYLSKI